LLAELRALQRVAKSEIHRSQRDADRARRRLNASTLEGLHQLLEALTLFLTEQVLCRYFEAVEADLIFLHAAIAEHTDLAAAHALRWKHFTVGEARLLGEEHRKAAIAGRARGAYQKRHHIGARRMRDPCLVAGDLVDVA